MKYTIVWHEIGERVYEVDAESFEDAVELVKDGWNSGELASEGAALFNEYTCEETGERIFEENGYW